MHDNFLSKDSAKQPWNQMHTRSSIKFSAWGIDALIDKAQKIIQWSRSAIEYSSEFDAQRR